MACPTCSHSMARLGCQYSECCGSWHCHRCGTIKIGHEDGTFDVIAPALVERCRKFEPRLEEICDSIVGEWQRLGIAESIRPEEERKP